MFGLPPTSRAPSGWRRASSTSWGTSTARGPWPTPSTRWTACIAGHPYRVLGEATVRDGLALFDDSVPGYRGGHTDANALVPTDTVGRSNRRRVTPRASHLASRRPAVTCFPRRLRDGDGLRRAAGGQPPRSGRCPLRRRRRDDVVPGRPARRREGDPVRPGTRRGRTGDRRRTTNRHASGPRGASEGETGGPRAHRISRTTR